MGQAADHWTRAADMLDAVRAQLPPVELRSSFMENRGDPYLRLIRKDADSEPGNAAVWSERYKMAGIWTPIANSTPGQGARSRAEQSLQQLARQVTALSQKIDGKEGKRSRTTAAVDPTLSRLQREVRLSLAEIGGGREQARNRSLSIRNDIRSISRKYPVVQFHHDGGDLIAFIHEDGITRSHRYHDGRRMIGEFSGCWNILLGRSMLSTENQSSGSVADERRLFSQIGDWLWAPLELGSNHQQVLILPDGKLANLPWSAIEYQGNPLISRWTMIISPSFRHHIHAARKRVRSNRIEVFVGDRSGLTHTTRELSFLQRVEGSDVTVHDPCTRNSWPRRGEAQLWHFTGHAQFRSDNPFYSSLALVDGPMFAVDFRLRQCNVGLVTLAACRTAGQSLLPGEESTGLVRSLLEMGARNVVASHWAVADESTALFMKTFYEKIIAGRPIGESIRLASIDVRDVYPSAYHWAAFSLFGAG
jgi:hypothetical protein